MAVQHLDKKTKIKKGFVALLSVIVLSAFGVTVITASLSVDTDNIIAVSTMERAKRAKAMVDSCAEVAINKLKTNLAYTGNETITIDSQTCSIGVISGTGNTNRTFQASATVNDATKKVSVSITTVNPLTVINSWAEVP